AASCVASPMCRTSSSSNGCRKASTSSTPTRRCRSATAPSSTTPTGAGSGPRRGECKDRGPSRRARFAGAPQDEEGRLALANYTDVQTAIATWLAAAGDAEVTGNAADFILLAEQRINRGAEGSYPSPPLRLQAMETVDPDFAV